MSPTGAAGAGGELPARAGGEVPTRAGDELPARAGSELPTRAGAASPPTALAVILNPFGGGGRAQALFERCRPRLEAAGMAVECHASRHRGHAAELARTVPLPPGGALCAVGGDGTVHEVINGILRRPGVRPPLGILPAGSGNALMLDLAASDPGEALRRLLAGRRRALDVARLRGGFGELYAFHLVGWGLVAAVAARAERLRWLGRRRYRLASVWELLRQHARPARLVLPGETIEGPLRLLYAGNTRHSGDGMQLTPDARLDDGRLDLLVVRGGTRLQLLQLMRRMSAARHLDSPLVMSRRVERFRLEAEGDGPLNVDGELAAGTPLEVQVLPRAIELLV